MVNDARRCVHRLAWLVAAVCLLSACKEQPESKPTPRLALVPDGPSPFWDVARGGIEEAEQQFNVICEYRLPPRPTVDLQRPIIVELLDRDVSGMIICPVDPHAEADELARACQQMGVICMLRDAPQTDRLCYVGTDDQQVGRLMAAEWPRILPPGSTVAVMTSHPDRPPDRDRLAGLEEALAAGEGLTLRKIAVDPGSSQAQSQLREVVSGDQGVRALVALHSAYADAIHAVLADDALPDDLIIVCADASAATLSAIERGRITRSVVDQPAEIAFHAVRILVSVLGGDESAVPEGGRFLVPPLVIDRANVDVFLDRAGVASITTRATMAADGANVSSPAQVMDDDPAR